MADNKEGLKKGPGLALLRKPRPPKRTVQLLASQSQGNTAEYLEFGCENSPEHNPRWNTAVTRTSGGTTYVDGDKRQPFELHPLGPKGPPFFKPTLKGNLAPAIPHTLQDEILFKSLKEISKKDKFILNSFLLPVKLQPPPTIKAGCVSRQNYEKLTSWFAHNVPSQEQVNTSVLDLHVEQPPIRVPKHQVIIELQRMMRHLLQLHDRNSSVNREDLETNFEAGVSTQPPQWAGPKPDDILFRTCVTQYFCGQGRSTSPFHEEGQPHCSPAEVAILESMLVGGQQLILKALFISELPPLTPLAHTLTYLNLSFNCFNDFPQALLELRCLGFLSMRNNPIRVIPNGIRRLQSLCILCLSFCILSELPSGLYELKNLADLDVSYNDLTSLSRDIGKLKNLHRLNVEGNQLPGLPCTMLSITPAHILLGNNLMQPVFWRHRTNVKPQPLTDICSKVVSRNVSQIENLQRSQFAPLTGILQRSLSGKCDACEEALYGAGLSVTRGVEHGHYSIKNLPFIFRVCSPECCSELRKRPDKYWLQAPSVT